jgi:hypothetical protein
MKITAPIAGTRQIRAKEVSMATFFLQDPKCDLELHHKRWSKRLPGAILFKAAFDKPLLSDRLLSRAKVGLKECGQTTSTIRKSRSTTLQLSDEFTA